MDIIKEMDELKDIVYEKDKNIYCLFIDNTDEHLSKIDIGSGNIQSIQDIERAICDTYITYICYDLYYNDNFHYEIRNFLKKILDKLNLENIDFSIGVCEDLDILFKNYSSKDMINIIQNSNNNFNLEDKYFYIEDNILYSLSEEYEFLEMVAENKYEILELAFKHLNLEYIIDTMKKSLKEE